MAQEATAKDAQRKLTMAPIGRTADRRLLQHMNICEPWIMDYHLLVSFAVVHPAHLVMVVGNTGIYKEWMQHLSKRHSK